MKNEVLYFMAHEFLENRFSWVMKMVGFEVIYFMGHEFSMKLTIMYLMAHELHENIFFMGHEKGWF